MAGGIIIAKFAGPRRVSLSNRHWSISHARLSRSSAIGQAKPNQRRHRDPSCVVDGLSDNQSFPTQHQGSSPCPATATRRNHATFSWAPWHTGTARSGHAQTHIKCTRPTYAPAMQASMSTPDVAKTAPSVHSQARGVSDMHMQSTAYNHQPM